MERAIDALAEPCRGIRLEASQIEKKKSGKRILGGYLNLQVPASGFVGLLGPSGSGKSTLLKALCGLEPPSKGQVLYDGQNLYADPGRWRAVLGYVPQEDILHQELSVVKALTYAARLRLPESLSDATRKALVTRVMHQVGLQERAQLRIRRLSGGQRKRASVAVELLNQPRILFLDEPTSGLDPQLEESQMQLFRQLSRDGTTVLITTHAMANVELLDAVILLQAGQLAYAGPPRELLDFFEVRSYEAVFKVLAKAKPGEWPQRFHQRRPKP